MKANRFTSRFIFLLAFQLAFVSPCHADESAPASATAHVQSISVPADKFDLSHWKINVPTDVDNDGKVDEVSVTDIKRFAHPDFFYLNSAGEMVFTAPNNALKTKNTTNTRSELRQMLRGENESIHTRSPQNNFALNAHPNAQSFAAIGGKMQATLKVNHVALRAGLPKKKTPYTVVVGQIHAGKNKDHSKGFGWSNEPLKIFYKKFPHHETGSVFWTYERNLPRSNKQRKDIVYPVWGNTWKNRKDPKAEGILLGESFSYEVNVYQNVMYLSFNAAGRKEVSYEIDLSNNVDAYGNVDALDHPQGYAGDYHYFKAGAYNQCSQKKAKCLGTGDWALDKTNGDYTSVAFSQLTLGEATPPAKLVTK